MNFLKSRPAPSHSIILWYFSIQIKQNTVGLINLLHGIAASYRLTYRHHINADKMASMSFSQTITSHS